MEKEPSIFDILLYIPARLSLWLFPTSEAFLLVERVDLYRTNMRKNNDER
jgi:cobalamin biosynthesis protein CobD/CbiB